jgi:hypothetical protein
MAEPDEPDIEARMRRLEHEVVQLRDDVVASLADAAAARVLAGGADREVSEVRTELRAHTQVLIALHETQLEQGPQITQHSNEIGALRSELHSQTAQLRTEMQRGFGMLQTGMAQITALLTGRRGLDSD